MESTRGGAWAPLGWFWTGRSRSQPAIRLWTRSLQTRVGTYKKVELLGLPDGSHQLCDATERWCTDHSSAVT